MITVAENRNLKKERVYCGFTQESLAKAVGVSRQTIVSIEKGNYNPSLNLCKAICKKLNKTLDELFWGEQ